MFKCLFFWHSYKETRRSASRMLYVEKCEHCGKERAWIMTDQGKGRVSLNWAKTMIDDVKINLDDGKTYL